MNPQTIFYESQKSWLFAKTSVPTRKGEDPVFYRVRLFFSASGVVMRTLLLGICLVCLPEFGEATTYSAGDGHNGALIISASRVEDTTLGLVNITASAGSGQKNVALANTSPFLIGDLVFLIQMQGAGAGQHEFNRIDNIVSNILVLKSNIVNSYDSTGAQVIKVGEYSSVSINSGGSWSASAWNGTTGGILVAVSSGNIVLNSGGSIGYIGGFFGGTCGGRSTIYPECVLQNASQGYGVSGTTPIVSKFANGNGGGAGKTWNLTGGAGGGGGGGNATIGAAGGGSDNDGGQWGNGGNAGGAATLENSMLMGGGGGGGGFNASATPASEGKGGSGGTGGGIIFLVAGGNITFNGGNVQTNGGGGGNGIAGSTSYLNAGGGGGAGGSIRLLTQGTIALGTGIVTATGGTAGTAPGSPGNPLPVGSSGGAGSDGRIATISAATVTGASSPNIDATSSDLVDTYSSPTTSLNPSFTDVYVTSLTVNWTAVSGANYVAVLASNSGYSSIVSSVTQSGITKTFVSLSTGTTYYFQVKLSTETDVAYTVNRTSGTTRNYPAPTLAWTGESNYSEDGLNPETGNTATSFVYRVKYTDADNDAPASGYPKLYILKSATTVQTLVMNYVSGTNNTGAIYSTSTVLSALGTDYSYHFEAQDANSAVATGTPTGLVDAPDVIVNTAPTLAWTGEANYTADGLNPETGNTATSFVYRVKYTDADNDAPAGGYPKLYILKSATTVQTLVMNYVSGANNTGAIYSTSTVLSALGADYSYHFEAQDANSAVATGTPTGLVDAPDVTIVNAAPTLAWTGEANYTADGLNPETGNTATSFVYRVKYTDADNDAPASGYPKLYIKKGGTEISGSPFTMSFVSGAYNTGATYTYSKTLATVGADYTYYFEAQDVNTTAATGVPTSLVDAPDVAEIPLQGDYKTTLGDNLFNPKTGGTSKVKFNVPAAGSVSLKIYDLSGKLIRTLFEGSAAAGDMQKDWDGRDDGGRYVVPSVYFLHYVYPGGKEVRKIGVKK